MWPQLLTPAPSQKCRVLPAVAAGAGCYRAHSTRLPRFVLSTGVWGPMLRLAVLCALIATALGTAPALTAAQEAFSCKGCARLPIMTAGLRRRQAQLCAGLSQQQRGWQHAHLGSTRVPRCCHDSTVPRAEPRRLAARSADRRLTYSPL